ncbi:iron complex outermembrane receptor protein [Caulobacter rhizosphaerae]|jgi:iron complex outermembrane receptor protein|uniref:Iron complex outermembrane receptor protein n=1 Tax=Caulobacter rhizosphaerae TaxID=2010972 RepID=A0ABU1N512_9CAUL|nr:TonB-dependent receptor [Caulobacter rhizosphaerae]MDR6533160.1 iron complex outermembrane receptor protein [Caulobacter rhizosphaerae]
MRKFHKTILTASASMLAVALAAPAFAQDSTQVDEVVVTGIRASLQASVEAKRNANAVIDVITAEDIGKFPDKNVAESLQRVPGVTIQREFGEGERISIRGTAPTLNRTLLNGHAVATADWFILDQFKASRSFNYLMLPSEIVGKVEVFKSPMADIDEGGVGGTVNVHTRNPLDLAPLSVSGSIQAFHDEKSGNTDPTASAMLSWHNADKTLGVLVGGIYDKRRIRRDGIEVLGYQAVTTASGAGNISGITPGQTVYAPSLIGSSLFTQTRERKGANFAIQYAPTDKFELNLTGLYSKMDADNFNQNYMAWISQKVGALSTSPGSQFNITRVENGTATAGNFNAIGGNGVVFDAIDRIAHTSVGSIDLAGKWRPADGWEFSGRVGYTKAKGATDLQPFWETNAPTGLTYDLSNGLPKVSFTDINPTTADDEMTLGWASANTTVNDDDEFYTFVDGEKFLDGGVFSSVKFGLKYTDHDRDVVQTYGQRRALLNNGTGCSNNACGLDDVANGLTDGDYLKGIRGPGVLSSYLTADKNKIEAIYAKLGPATVYDPNNPNVGGCINLNNCDHFGPLESFDFNEKTFGGYVMGNLKGEGWRGNVGVRVVNTKIETNAWRVGVSAGTPGAINNPFGLMAPTSGEKEYTDILPSANFSFDVRDDVVIRLAAGRVLARPDYAQMAGFTSLTESLLTASGGNPDLDPYRANQYDAAVEWYFAPQSILSVDFFYKDISTYIVQGATVEKLPLQAAANDPRVVNPANNCVLQSAGLYSCDYNVGRPVNVAGGETKGFEVNFQMPVWNGFGVLANYTYSDASSSSGVPVPSNSKNIFNVSGYYENERFSARLSYNYRSKFFVDYDAERGYRQLWSDSIASLDASASVNLTDQISLSLDAVNLTDEKQTDNYDNDKNRPARIYKNGRMVFGGVRFKF